jgi:hypothetical protein
VRPRALADLALPVEAPATSTLAQLAERAGCSLVETRRMIVAVARGLDADERLDRRELRVVCALYDLSPIERHALIDAVAP